MAALLAGCGGDEAATERQALTEAKGKPSADAVARARIADGLRRGVEAAAKLGGDVEAAAMLDGWEAPLVESSEPGGGERPMRMWSMSKVATMVALLRGLGWGERPGAPPSPEVEDALQGAITRSENCRQRRVVLELQRMAGSPAGARVALADVFTDVGARALPGSELEPPESICLDYLQTQLEVRDPLAPALLLGTSTWRISDAVRLVHALSVDAYGKSISKQVLGLLAEPKLASREVQAGELTAPLDWGVGAALPGTPAYKAGWGGSLNGDFLAGQIVLAEVPGGGRLAIAAMFHPDAQPSRDDPGITNAPQAVELVLDSVYDAASR
ncbi:MAG: hypothetical protein WD827_00925 [Solirubrobacterales bacterium]